MRKYKGWVDADVLYLRVVCSGQEEEDKSRLFNPPYVASLSFSEDGRHVAAALGDGTVRFNLSMLAIAIKQSSLLISSALGLHALQPAHASSARC